MKTFTLPTRTRQAGSRTFSFANVPANKSEASITLDIDPVTRADPSIYIECLIEFSDDGQNWRPGGGFGVQCGSIPPDGVPPPGVTVSLQDEAGNQARVTLSANGQTTLGASLTVT